MRVAAVPDQPQGPGLVLDCSCRVERRHSRDAMDFSSSVAKPVIGQARISLDPAFRAPRRITITLPYATYHQLLGRSEQEGRSLSNLAAYLLETAIGSRSPADR